MADDSLQLFIKAETSFAEEMQENKDLNLHRHQKHRSGTSQLCLKSLQTKLF